MADQVNTVHAQRRAALIARAHQRGTTVNLDQIRAMDPLGQLVAITTAAVIDQGRAA